MNPTEIKNLLKATTRSAKITQLIAEEKINVEYSEHADTASYSRFSRTITYPYSMVMEDDDIHMLFVFHEVAHALYSKDDSLLRESVAKGFQSYFNIVEDIRIERLIKHKYPGVVRNFNAGYMKLLDKGFFGNVNSIKYGSFPNRLNVYAKMGAMNGRFIQFDKNETDFYNRCITAETELDAFNLAKELQRDYSDSRHVFDHIKIMIDSSFDPITIVDDISKMVDSYVATPEETPKKSDFDVDEYINATKDMDEEFRRPDPDDEPAPKRSVTPEQLAKLSEYLNAVDTVKEFDDNFKQTNINNCSIVTFDSLKKDFVDFVSAKKYASVVSSVAHVYECRFSEMRQFRNECKTAVDSMVREFEAKKAAYRYKNAKISNTGTIDVNRLVGYKFSDEIFSKQIALADAKNHGFVILLDCSGSIHGVFDSMCKQVIILTEFFRRIGVSYRVFGYGAGLYNEIDTNTYNEYATRPANQMTTNVCKTLLEFLNSDLSNAEHAAACVGMLNMMYFTLGDTPTVQALLQMEHLANEFFAANKVTKKKIINITDGQPSDSHENFRYNAYHSGRNSNRPIVLIDPVTKKNHVIRRCAFSAADAIAAVYKDRYNIDTFNIGIGASSLLTSFIGRSINDVETKFLNANKFCEFKSETGNTVFIARPVDVTTEITADGVSAKSTVTVAARSFIKELKKSAISKNFMNILAKNLSV